MPSKGGVLDYSHNYEHIKQDLQGSAQRRTGYDVPPDWPGRDLPTSGGQFNLAAHQEWFNKGNSSVPPKDRIRPNKAQTPRHR